MNYSFAYECKDCDHLMVCKYTDAGDGRCRHPQYFRNKHALPVVVGVSSKTLKALENIGKAAHGGDNG